MLNAHCPKTAVLRTIAIYVASYIRIACMLNTHCAKVVFETIPIVSSQLHV